MMTRKEILFFISGVLFGVYLMLCGNCYHYVQVKENKIFRINKYTGTIYRINASGEYKKIELKEIKTNNNN